MDSATVADWNERSLGTLGDVLGMRFIELAPDRVVATMPVERRVHQPFGLLHGGASVALAETVASVGANLNVDTDKQIAVGMEINANHLRAVREGNVTATAVPLHRGLTSQVWEIRIVDDADRLVCISRCTLGVRPKP